MTSPADIRNHTMQTHRYIQFASRSPIPLFLWVTLLSSLNIYYLVKMSSNLPFQDDWRLVSQLSNSPAPSPAQWIFSRDNGHIIAPSKIVFLITEYTHIGLSWIRYLHIPLLLAAIYFYWRFIIKKDEGGIITIFAASCLIFGLYGWADYGYAMGFTKPLSILLSCLAFYYYPKGLDGKKTDLFWTASLLVFSVLSFGTGYLAIATIAAGTAIKFLPSKIMPKSPVCGYIALAFTLILMIASLVEVSPHIITRIFLVLGAFAAPLATQHNPELTLMLCTILGAALLAFSLIILSVSLKTKTGDVLTAQMLIIFSLACGMAVAYSRRDLPLSQMHDSRYAIQCIPLCLGLLYLRQYFIPLFHKVFLGLLIALSIYSLTNELHLSKPRSNAIAKMANAYDNLPAYSDDQLRGIFFWGEIDEIKTVYRSGRFHRSQNQIPDKNIQTQAE